MDEIFEYIKIKNFDKIKEILLNDKNNELNLNIHDNQYNFLIHYIIIFNQIEILKILLMKNARIDIIDKDGKNILFTTIKYNYVEAVKLIIEYNNKIIGISVLDNRDVLGRTCLHYCVLLDNIECLKILMKAGSNPYIKDNNFNNVLEFAMKDKNIEIIKYLLDVMDYNFLSKNNETILQQALQINSNQIFNLILGKKIDLNNQDKKYGLAILHQSISQNNYKFVEKILELNADINIQDHYGNTPLMYAVIDNFGQIIELLINKSNLNYNLTNIEGETAFHIILKNNIDSSDYIIKFIENTDLNIQDNDGNTCLYYMVKNDLIDKYKNELKLKDLDIFIENKNNEKISDKINLDVIIDSYYNHLIKNQDKLIVDWEIWCSKTEFDNIKKVDCKEKIKKIIKDEKRSLPKMNNDNLALDNGIFVNNCFYTGAPIDILFGLIFLFQKFDDIDLILDYPLTINKELELSYKSHGINYNYKLDFCNFEINWLFQKLIFPDYFNAEIKNKIKNNNYIVIPLGIEQSNGVHANILFYDVKKKKVERFEPYGARPPINLNYNPVLLDKLLEYKFKTFDEEIKYIKPSDYLPVISFQLLETSHFKCRRIGDPNGFCGIWCIWWVYHKMKNINMESNLLAEKLIKQIKFSNESFKNIIRNFSKNVTDLRDKYLEKNNLDINDIMVGNHTDDKINNIEKDILNIIK